MTKPTTRQPGWQVKLDELVRNLSCREYEWGTFDCCTLAGDVVLVITGVDPIADVRGKYSTEQGAYRILARLGGMESAWSARLGQSIAVPFAQVGDIGITGTAAVFFGGACWLGASDIGLTPVDSPRVAWRCCRV